MHVRKFIAGNARTALKKVKDALGSDAIILSNRAIPQGVEILAVAAREMAMVIETDDSGKQSFNTVNQSLELDMDSFKEERTSRWFDATNEEKKQLQESPSSGSAPRRALASLSGTAAEGVAEKDSLGRKHIVEALSLLITQRKGKQHFALGLFGRWGTGKSSLIHQLTLRLKQEHPEIVVAEFNAWKNEKATSLGAMLAQSVVDALTEQLSWVERLKLALKLEWKKNRRAKKALEKDVSFVLRFKSRLRQSAWWWILLPPALILVALATTLWAIPVPPLAKWLGVPTLVGWITLASLSKFVQDNLMVHFKKVNASKYLEQLKLPDYGTYRGLLGEIHRALASLCELTLEGSDTTNGRTLVLVIDDLDRCGADAVKETLDAIRLVADIPRVIALVAVDERIAFAAVEKHYEYYGQPTRPSALVAREYLAKVFQASIRLGDASDQDVQTYVTDVLFGAADLDGGQITLPNESARKGVETRLPIEETELAAKDVPQENRSLPGEGELFGKLALAYNFRNPRLMWRLHLAWRLLKVLHFGKSSYDFDQAEPVLRLLFWREYRLQQPAEMREELDSWLVNGAMGGRHAHLAPALKGLTNSMAGTFMGRSWNALFKVTDAVLLPAGRQNAN